MFCPQCGSQQSSELKFCKSCGANLHAVLQVINARETGEKFDWSQTWVAEMFLSEGERKRRLEELERRRGITPEIKRYNEIKAGVITSFVGVAVMIFLFVLMRGIILGGKVPEHDVELLSRIWIAGIIPFFIGLALIVNGLFVSKKIAQIINRQAPQQMPKALGNEAPLHSLPAADTGEFIAPNFSVTEDTTRHLNAVKPKK